MMQLTLDENPSKYQIRAYEPSKITINEQVYTSSLLVCPDALSEWSVNAIADLTAADMQEILTLKPEIILLGSGEELIMPSPELLAIAQEQRVGIEVMTNSAACRTFSILTAEQRRVVLGIIL